MKQLDIISLLYFDLINHLAMGIKRGKSDVFYHKWTTKRNYKLVYFIQKYTNIAFFHILKNKLIKMFREISSRYLMYHKKLWKKWLSFKFLRVGAMVLLRKTRDIISPYGRVAASLKLTPVFKKEKDETSYETYLVIEIKQKLYISRSVFAILP